MLTSKQAAELRSKANGLDVLIHIGKGGISEALTTETAGALAAHELVKCRVLESAMLTAYEAADTLAAATGSDVVSVVGATFVIYKYNPKKHQSPQKKKIVNPVKAGVKRREKQSELKKRAKDEYFAKQRREKNKPE